MFVVATDFDGLPFSLPKIEESNDFDIFLAAEEEKLLRQLLGHMLYDDFIEGLAEEYPLQKWTDLKEGATYTCDSNTYKWVGLEGKRGLLVPYIYAMWVRENNPFFTAIGTVSSKTENATVISNSHKVVNAFNQMSILAGYDYSQRNTLYGFLKNNTDDYGEVEFCSPGTMNIFNL